MDKAEVLSLGKKIAEIMDGTDPYEIQRIRRFVSDGYHRKFKLAMSSGGEEYRYEHNEESVNLGLFWYVKSKEVGAPCAGSVLKLNVMVKQSHNSDYTELYINYSRHCEEAGEEFLENLEKEFGEAKETEFGYSIKVEDVEPVI